MMPRTGFIPLSSSVMSSEPEYEQAGRHSLSALSANITASTLAANSLRELPKARPPSHFSFASIPTKRARTAGSGQAKRNPDHELEQILLQPVTRGEKAPLMSFEELEDLLNQPNIPESTYTASQDSSRMEYAALPAELEDIESLLLADSVSSAGGRQPDPFFGAPKNYTEPRVPLATPRPTERRRMVTVHELSVQSVTTPTSMQVKGRSAIVDAADRVVLSRRPNPITPNFSRRIAAKAVESKDRSKVERRQYNEFLRDLCTGSTWATLISSSPCRRCSRGWE